MNSTIDGAIEAAPEARPELEKKKAWFDNFKTAIQDRQQYQEAVHGVEAFLQRVEDELVTHVGGKARDDSPGAQAQITSWVPFYRMALHCKCYCEDKKSNFSDWLEKSGVKLHALHLLSIAYLDQMLCCFF